MSAEVKLENLVEFVKDLKEDYDDRVDKNKEKGSMVEAFMLNECEHLIKRIEDFLRMNEIECEMEMSL